MKKVYTDEELAELAQWAEEQEQGLRNPTTVSGGISGNQLTLDKKKAYGAIRQGIDWLLRTRIIEKGQDIAAAGKPSIVERKQ